MPRPKFRYPDRPFTPAEDAAIVELRAAGHTSDRIALTLGRPAGCVTDRYARLAYEIRRRRKAAARTIRICLFHGGPFASEWAGNRICPECRKSEEWEGAAALP